MLTARVTQALPDNAPALAALLAEALPPGWPPEDLERSCRMKARVVLKACDTHILPVGLAIIQVAADEAEILVLAVKEASRRQGIAGALMRAVLDTCRSTKIARVYLEVEDGNIPALALYAKFAFQLFARRRSYYELGREKSSDALILRRDLMSSP